MVSLHLEGVGTYDSGKRLNVFGCQDSEVSS